MNYTLEDIKNAYGVLILSNKGGGRIWLEINNGTGFDEYYMCVKEYKINMYRCSTTSYRRILHFKDDAGFYVHTFLYDQENFIRHFGAYFLKF